jgi:hypothetical protein
MPLTSEYMLHCGWQGDLAGVPTILVDEQLIKSMNRRIACGATRCIFYHRDENWILSAAMNKEGAVAAAQMDELIAGAAAPPGPPMGGFA